MMNVRVIKKFWDRKDRRTRRPGDVFVTTDARAYELKERLPDHVEIGEPDAKPRRDTSVTIELLDETFAPQEQVTEDAVAQPAEETVVQPVEEAVDAATADVDYDDMTVAELKAVCAERGIEVPKRAKKAQLIALLEG